VVDAVMSSDRGRPGPRTRPMSSAAGGDRVGKIATVVVGWLRHYALR
jgi:hypothetical protein